MNGVHDMGGMHGMGPIQPEPDEPVFHERWEARAFGLVRAMGAFGRWNIDASRHQRELIPAAEQLRMSYYERWLTGLTQLLLKHGFISAEELASGKPAPGHATQTPALMAQKVPAFVARGAPASRNSGAPARFHPGQPVRARNLNPTGHTRLPRYVRGKTGVIDHYCGQFENPEERAYGRIGRARIPLYRVRLSQRDLWPDYDGADGDTLVLEIYHHWLRSA